MQVRCSVACIYSSADSHTYGKTDRAILRKDSSGHIGFLEDWPAGWAERSQRVYVPLQSDADYSNVLSQVMFHARIQHRHTTSTAPLPTKPYWSPPRYFARRRCARWSAVNGSYGVCTQDMSRGDVGRVGVRGLPIGRPQPGQQGRCTKMGIPLEHFLVNNPSRDSTPFEISDRCAKEEHILDYLSALRDTSSV